jgi:hypothetical protein
MGHSFLCQGCVILLLPLVWLLLCGRLSEVEREGGSTTILLHFLGTTLPVPWLLIQNEMSAVCHAMTSGKMNGNSSMTEPLIGPTSQAVMVCYSAIA